VGWGVGHGKGDVESERVLCEQGNAVGTTEMVSLAGMMPWNLPLFAEAWATTR